jgi:YggT family protein
MRFLSSITDPVLDLARRWFPLRLGGIDFSPIIIIIVLNFLAGPLGAFFSLVGKGAPVSVAFPIIVTMLLQILSYLTWLLMILMVARIIISLVNPPYNNTLVLIVYGLTEPLLAPLRRWFPKGPKGVDIKAVVFLIGLFLFDSLITNTLINVSATWLLKVSSGWIGPVTI